MTAGAGTGWRRTAGRMGAALLFAVIALLLAPIVLPPFLDRIYYRGPATDHYDGRRFFNPDGDALVPQGARWSPLGMIRYMTRQRRTPWPAQVPVVPGHPAARVAGAAMRVTWIGHSTALVQTQGLNILTDPVWSDRVGPWGLIGPARVRAPGVRFDDLPRIDLVLVSHDHYDHMDLATLRRLWLRDRPLIVSSLGNDRVMGLPAVTRDWGGRVAVRPGVEVIVERVHHWGSRWGADRNRALWSGFTVVLPGGNLFFAGDTGWGDGAWPKLAARDGPYRLAILPIGAFQPRAMMSPSHIGPVEAADIFGTLGAAYGLGVHWGTFRLSSEGFDEPPRLLARTLADRGVAPDRFRTLLPGTAWDVPSTRSSDAKQLESAAQK